MEVSLSEINWPAVGASVVAGQIISTLWFTVLFGDPWAKEYGAEDRKQHTKDIPGYTYAVQVACTIALVLTLALLQVWLGVESIVDARVLAVVVSIGFCVATLLPGQAFLGRWRVFAIAAGSQGAMIFAISIILGAWH